MSNAGIAKTSAVLRHTHCNGHGKGPGRAAGGQEQIQSVDGDTVSTHCHFQRAAPPQFSPVSPTSNGAERLSVVFLC